MNRKVSTASVGHVHGLRLGVDPATGEYAKLLLANPSAGQTISAGDLTLSTGNLNVTTGAIAVNGTTVIDNTRAVTAVSIIVSGSSALQGNVTTSSKLTTAASAASRAGFTLPHGAAPTAPDNGDLWTTTAGLYARINGATKTVNTSAATVTSVGLSAPNIFSVTNTPVTTSGTLTLSLANQNANMIFAGPASGAAAAPTFRALVSADLPSATATVKGGVIVGSNITLSSDTISLTGTNVTAALGYTPLNKAGDTMSAGLTISSNTATLLTLTKSNATGSTNVTMTVGSASELLIGNGTSTILTLTSAGVLNLTNALQISGTTVIDSSQNLVNVNDFTASNGNITLDFTTNQQPRYIQAVTTATNSPGASLRFRAADANPDGVTSQNLPGGNVFISSGASVGTGASSIVFSTPSAAGAAGTTKNLMGTRLTVRYDGIDAYVPLKMSGTTAIDSSRNFSGVNGTLSGKLTLKGTDTARLVESLNASATDAVQFYIDHAGAATNIGNARGALNLLGNASTATKLATSRAINGVNFDGSAAITVTANTTNTLTRGSYLTGSNFNGSAATTWAVDATSANTASKVVARDANGDFAARTATLTGDLVITGGFKSSTAHQFLTTTATAQSIHGGGLLVSDNYADAVNIPANGIWAKGRIATANVFESTYNNTGHGVGGFYASGSASWYMFDMGVRGASSGRYGIGVGAAESDRNMSFHIPNHAAYASTGTIPSFGWYNNGAVKLMSLQADSGDLWTRGSIRAGLDTGNNTLIDTYGITFSNATQQDLRIQRNGENLEFIEPEDTNKVWMKYTDDTGLYVLGYVNASSTIQTNGTTRIDASGNLSNIGTIDSSSITVRAQDAGVEGGEIKLLGAGTKASWSWDNYDGYLRWFTDSVKASLNASGDFNAVGTVSAGSTVQATGTVKVKDAGSNANFQIQFNSTDQTLDFVYASS